MEFINKIELQGIVGSSYSRPATKGNTAAQFSLMTEYAHHNPQGEPVVDITWFNVLAWSSTTNFPVETIKKGDTLRIEGRIRMASYADQYGGLKYKPEIIAQTIKRL